MTYLAVALVLILLIAYMVVMSRFPTRAERFQLAREQTLRFRAGGYGHLSEESLRAMLNGCGSYLEFNEMACDILDELRKRTHE